MAPGGAQAPPPASASRPPRKAARPRRTKAVTKATVLAPESHSFAFVRDDGSCWLWAVLAGLNLCQHATPDPYKAVGGARKFRQGFRPTPTARDRALDLLIRDRVWEAMKEAGADKGYSARSIDEGGQYVEVVPDGATGLAGLAAKYDEDGNCETLASFATAGGGNVEYKFLSRVLGVEVAWWDEGKHANRARLSDGSYVTPDFFVELAKPVVHVSWSSLVEDHVDGYIPKTPVVVPGWLADFLREWEEGVK